MIKKYGLSIFVNELLSSLSDYPINYHPAHDSCTKVFQLSALIFIYVLENLASDFKSILVQVDEILISSNKFKNTCIGLSIFSVLLIINLE
jgi:hypothetical protein